MRNGDPDKDGDPKPRDPTKNTSDGNGHEKPGLVIDVVLPKEEPNAAPEMGKKH